MRRIAIAALAFCSFATTSAANPILTDWLYVDFDPPNYVHSVFPEPFSTLDAYIVMNLELSLYDEFRSVSFRLEVTPGMSGAPTFTCLLPGATVSGDWETGLTITSADCVEAFPATVGKLTLLYLGSPGDVLIRDHPDFPRSVVNCSDPGTVFEYCVWSHGGVGKEAVSGDCGANAADDVTWTAMKALYR